MIYANVMKLLQGRARRYTFTICIGDKTAGWTISPVKDLSEGLGHAIVKWHLNFRIITNNRKKPDNMSKCRIWGFITTKGHKGIMKTNHLSFTVELQERCFKHSEAILWKICRHIDAGLPRFLFSLRKAH